MAKQAKQSADDSPEEVGFDARLAELEAIVGELEDGELSLEEAIERYGAGVQLLRRCHAQLGEYRARVEELSREAEGALSAFDEDPDLPADGAEA
jgi:exodeoxyribonuclease VII small subunit